MDLEKLLTEADVKPAQVVRFDIEKAARLDLSNENASLAQIEIGEFWTSRKGDFSD